MSNVLLFTILKMLKTYSDFFAGNNLIQNYSWSTHFLPIPPLKEDQTLKSNTICDLQGDTVSYLFTLYMVMEPFCIKTIRKCLWLTFYSIWAYSDIGIEIYSSPPHNLWAHLTKGASHLACKGDCVAKETRIRKWPGCWFCEIHSNIFRRQFEHEMRRHAIAFVREMTKMHPPCWPAIPAFSWCLE